MTELDRHSEPLPKVEGDRARPRGQTGAARPHAVLTQDVSTDTQFEHLMAEHLDPHRTPSPSPPPFRRPRVRDALALRPESPPCSRWHRERDARTLRPTPPDSGDDQYVLHSASHILVSCPLVSVFHSQILKDYSFRYLFWSVKGATALATFLLCSNSLLRPLPARPDPP